MAKKSMIQRELKRTRLNKKYTVKRETIILDIKNSQTYQEKVANFKRLEQLPRNSFPSRQRNRCWITGRSRGFYKDFGLSRHILREMAHAGDIPGIKKSSW